nr:MAG TPA_asm: hypothetical protein [Bacteriophage sp.]
MEKINKMAYYALKGMLAENANNIDTIVKRLGFIAKMNPRIGDILVNGFAVDVKITNISLLRDYIGNKDITDIKAGLFTYESLEQYIDVTYTSNGRKYHKEFHLDITESAKWNMFELEYV